MKRELVSDIDRLRLAIDNWGLALVNEMQLLREAIVSINIDRKTESSSEKPNNCDEPQTDCLTCRYNSDEWDSPKCDDCCKAHSNYEPQTDCAWK